MATIQAMRACGWASCAVGAAVVAYLALGCFQIYRLMNPLDGVDIVGPTVDPLWAENQEFDFFAFLSTKNRLHSIERSFFRDNSTILIERRGLPHNRHMEEQKIFCNFSLAGDGAHTRKNDLLRGLATEINGNGSGVFLHVVLSRADPGREVTLSSILNNQSAFRSGDAVHGWVRLVKYDVIPRSFHARYLLSDFDLVPVSEDEKRRLSMPRNTVISYWKPEVSVKLINDFQRYPHSHATSTVRENAIQRDNSYFYKPAMHVDEIGLTSDKYLPLSAATSQLPLTISLGPMSSQRQMLTAILEQSLGQQKAFGFTDKDIDDMRRLITDTSVTLLAATMVASVLHLVFEMLAFQSDLKFWKEQKRHVGISLRSLVASLAMQVIVFAYLVTNEASLLVIVPSFISIGIQIWKTLKAYGVVLPSDWVRSTADGADSPLANASFEGGTSSLETVGAVCTAEVAPSVGCVAAAPGAAPGIRTTEDPYELVSQEADAFAYKYISLALSPLVLAFIAHSLIYEKHLGWFSFLVSSLTGCVYTFGFIMMFPQLYINHKLKSVSHLPWKFLVYKFINTFIDDLFAFVIKMPTMHRLSVFRDDIVFVIYLYQRYCYKVDSSRPAET